MSIETTDWLETAKRNLKADLEKHGISYKKLASYLSEDSNKKITEGSINGKINRGAFSHAWYLQCMRVIEINKNNSKAEL